MAPAQHKRPLVLQLSSAQADACAIIGKKMYNNYIKCI